MGSAKDLNRLFFPRWSSADAFDGEDIVLVTAMTPGYDLFVRKHHNKDSGIKFVAFLDQPRRSLRWFFLPICDKFPSMRMNAKIHKILIHEFFPNAKYTIWIDGNIKVTTKSLKKLIDMMGDDDIMLFRHSTRNCLYSEAHVCMVQSLDNNEKIFNQISKYTQEGYPHGNGLAECPVIIRKNNNATREFNRMWWDEITKGSSRDQISFPYVQFKTGIKVQYIQGTIHDNEFFEKANPHILGIKKIYKYGNKE